MSTEQPTTRVEWSGSLEVHYPIKPTRPTVHATLAEVQVSCA